MATYLILGKLSPEVIRAPGELRKLAEKVSQKMMAECPNVRWKDSYAVMGRFDVVDIVEADNPAELGKAAMIIRSYGRTQTETMPATPWKEFLASL